MYRYNARVYFAQASFEVALTHNRSTSELLTQSLALFAVVVTTMASDDAAASTWFFMCGPLAVNVFVFGLAWNLHVFKRHDFALDKVLDMRRDEVPTPAGVAGFACLLTAIQMTVFGVEASHRGDAFGADAVRMELLLLLYCTCAAMLLLCPFDVLHLQCRLFVLRRIGMIVSFDL